MTVEVLVRPWEKMIMGLRFTEVSEIELSRPERSCSGSPARCDPFRSRYTGGGKLLVEPDELWRCARQVRQAAANRDGTKHGCGRSSKPFKLQSNPASADPHQEEDPEEFYSNSGIPWRISKTEYLSVAEQRQ